MRRGGGVGGQNMETERIYREREREEHDGRVCVGVGREMRGGIQGGYQSRLYLECPLNIKQVPGYDKKVSRTIWM